MNDLMEMIVRLQGYLPSLENLAMSISWLIGIILIINAIMSAGKRSDVGQQAGSWGTPISKFLTGVAFIALPSVLSVLSFTLFRDTPSNASAIFEYAPQTVGLFDVGSEARSIIVAIVAIAMFAGVLAVMRGLFMLNAASQGSPQASYPAGLTFLGAGALAVNFPKFMGVLERWTAG